jgi:hypothetical protein
VWYNDPEIPLPDLIFHVGSPKTGTTTIQRYFKQHRFAAAQQGLLYPAAGSMHKGLAHHQWHRAFIANRQTRALDWIEDAEEEALSAQLQEEIERVQPAKVLFSSEAFSPESVKNIMARLPHEKVQVLLLLRRLDRYWESQYAQGIKTGFHKLSPDEFFTTRMAERPVWTRVYEPLCKYRDLGVELLIQPFEPAQMPQGLMPQVLKLLDLAGLPAPKEEASSNERLHPHVTQLLAQRSGEQRLIGEQYNRLIRQLAQYQAADGSPVKANLFSPAQRKAVLDLVREEYAQIAKEFLGREDRRLFFEPEPEPSDDWQPPSQVSLADAADMLLSLWERVWQENP